MRRSDSGEAAAAYIGILLLVASVTAAVLNMGIGVRVATACERAVCKITGGRCPDAGTGAPAAGASPAPAGTPPAPPELTPPRPPVVNEPCSPNPGATWAEGLHAHNDYANQTPLKDALRNGATSVEADVFWDPSGELVVKHDDSASPIGNLRDLYIDPLMERAEKNGGQIYPGRGDPDRPFRLVIEIKRHYPSGAGDPDAVASPEAIKAYADAKSREAFWNAIRQTEELRTRYPNVQVVFSGGRPSELIGRPDPKTGKVPAGVVYDLPPGPDCSIPPEVDPAYPGERQQPYNRDYAANFVMLNGEWSKCGDRDGDGKVGAEEQAKLDALVRRAHELGLRVRMWGGPDGRERSQGTKLQPGVFAPCTHAGCDDDRRKAAWQAQKAAGVDYLNTNHLGTGKEWVLNCGPKRP